MNPFIFQEVLLNIEDLGPEGTFFINSVEDLGEDVVKVDEYYAVGKTTEFRYGLKVKDSTN